MSPIIQWQCTAHWRHPPAFIIGQAAAVAGLLTHHVVEREKTVAQRKCIDRYKDSVFLPQTNNQHSTYNCFLVQCEQTSHWTWSCFTAFVFILDDDSVNWKVNIGIQRNAVDMWWQKKQSFSHPWHELFWEPFDWIFQCPEVRQGEPPRKCRNWSAN